MHLTVIKNTKFYDDLYDIFISHFKYKFTLNPKIFLVSDQLETSRKCDEHSSKFSVSANN